MAEYLRALMRYIGDKKVWGAWSVPLIVLLNLGLFVKCYLGC